MWCPCFFQHDGMQTTFQPTFYTLFKCFSSFPMVSIMTLKFILIIYAKYFQSLEYLKLESWHILKCIDLSLIIYINFRFFVIAGQKYRIHWGFQVNLQTTSRWVSLFWSCLFFFERKCEFSSFFVFLIHLNELCHI